MNFDDPEVNQLYSVIRIMDEKTGQVYSDKMGLRVLYLKKLETASEEERQTEVYHWARLISAKDWGVLQELSERNEYLKEAVEEMKLINRNRGTIGIWNGRSPRWTGIQKNAILESRD